MPTGIYDRTKSKLRNKISDDTRTKLSKSKMGNTNGIRKGDKIALGKHLKLSDKTKKKMSEAKLGVKMPQTSKENHYLWKKDRTQLVKRQERNDVAYKEWRKNVWIRDCYKCRLANTNCEGKITAHHIFNWSEFLELRYIINNGITLCRAHHPRKRAEEKQLIPIFLELVSVSN